MNNELKERLIAEEDFEKYIGLLGKAAKKHCILIVSNDTPCGSPQFTKGLATKLCSSLGTNILLHDKFRCTYIAAINKGKLIYENISTDNTIEFSHTINGVSIVMKSESFRADRKHKATMEIDGIDYWYKSRGLFFLVFDKNKKEILDRVSFDTYRQTGIISGPRTKISNSDWQKFYDSHSDVIFVDFSYPVFPTQNLSDNEKFIIENDLNYTKILQNSNKPISAISEYIPDEKGLYEVLSAPASYINTAGVRCFEDKKGKYLNIENGHRVTTGQPKDFKRSIWFVGPCQTFGIGSRDEGTVESFLQEMLNIYEEDRAFCVHNYGSYLWGTDAFEHILKLLYSLPIKPGDIVFGAPVQSAATVVGSKYGNRPHDFGELFWDTGHYTENGNRLVSKLIFETLSAHNFFEDKVSEKKTIIPSQNSIIDNAANYGLSHEQLEMLKSYKSSLSAFYKQQFGAIAPHPIIGSIVMNCNPFTLGHRYLIEQAAKKVDFLIIFVVQEDKSFFPFEDRIDLVDKGTEDIPNVAVTESGMFIISSLTFTEYFNKAEIQDRIIDSSLDVTLFAKEIAPAMHISVRFVGEEPFDRVTRQYNDTLKTILPQYGIRLEELPRVEYEGEAISASRVRKLMEQHQWDMIKDLVPKTTFEYLYERFYI